MSRKPAEKFQFFLIGPVLLPEYNAAFHSVGQNMRRQGFTVANLLEQEPDSTLKFAATLRMALPLLCASENALLLSNHKKCPLAILLVYMAQRLELPFYNVTSMAKMPEMDLKITFTQAVGDRGRARELLRELNEEFE